MEALTQAMEALTQAMEAQVRAMDRIAMKRFKVEDANDTLKNRIDDTILNSPILVRKNRFDAYVIMRNNAEGILEIIVLEWQNIPRTVYVERLNKESVLKAVRAHWRRHSLPIIKRFFLHKSVRDIAGVTNPVLLDRIKDPVTPDEYDPNYETLCKQKAKEFCNHRLNNLQTSDDVRIYLARLRIEEALADLSFENDKFNAAFGPGGEFPHQIKQYIKGVKNTSWL